jgi:hypothetical protein
MRRLKLINGCKCRIEVVVVVVVVVAAGLKARQLQRFIMPVKKIALAL